MRSKVKSCVINLNLEKSTVESPVTVMAEVETNKASIKEISSISQMMIPPKMLMQVKYS
jgi:hypothetical protein